MVTAEGCLAAARWMHTCIRSPGWRWLRTLLLIVAVSAVPLSPARADLLVSPATLTLELDAGGTGIVNGDITNLTGMALRSGDFFGSFSGFPSDALIIEQLLGLTDIAIPDRAVTRGLALFSVQLGSAARAGDRYDIEYFFGEGVGGNFAPPSLLLVTVADTRPVSEPPAPALVGGALLCLALVRRRHRAQPQPQEA